MAEISDEIWINAKRHLTGNCILPQKRPKHVYHYTSVEGLKGILTTSRLWATDVSFLNDTSEYVYADKVIDEALTELKPVNSGFEDALGLLGQDPRSQFDVYASCFCERGDLLSQWRAYAAGGIGYAVQFDLELLEKRNAATGHVTLGRVEYRPAYQKRLVRTIVSQLKPMLKTNLLRKIVDAHIDRQIEKAGEAGLTRFKAWKHIQRSATPFSELLPIIKPFLTTFGELTISRAFLKSSTFSEEKEWRIALFLPRTQERNASFRTSKGMLVPYIPMDVQCAGAGSVINRITIGQVCTLYWPRTHLSAFCQTTI